MVIPEKSRSIPLMAFSRVMGYSRMAALVSVLLLALFFVLNLDFSEQNRSTFGLGDGALRNQSDGSFAPSHVESGQATYLDIQVRLEPARPDSDDVIIVTISGISNNSCVPRYQSHQVTDNNVLVNTIRYPPAHVCLHVIIPWEISFQVGPLTAGEYGVAFNPLRILEHFSVTPASVSMEFANEGGYLLQRYPGHSTTLTVPPGALSMSTTFTISYQTPSTATGRLLGMDHFFDLMSTQEAFTVPLTLTMRYSDTTLGPIMAGTENLFRLQNGLWVTDEITLTTRLTDGLRAQITHLSPFALLGETDRIYMPIVSAD